MDRFESYSSQSHIRYQLESYGMLGTRLIEQRLKTVISVLEPNMTWFEFDFYLTKSMEIYCLMEYGFRPDETPPQKVVDQSEDASSLATPRSEDQSKSSSKSATSATSTKSERSEALSVDYSHKLNRAKNKDCSLALALYVTANQNASFLREKLVSNLIATMFTSVRKVGFKLDPSRIVFSGISPLKSKRGQGTVPDFADVSGYFLEPIKRLCLSVYGNE